MSDPAATAEATAEASAAVATTVRRLAAVIAAVLGAATLGGVLPGATTLLGAATSDAPMVLLRAALVAVLLVALLSRRRRELLPTGLAVSAAAMGAVGAWTVFDPHALGLLAHGAPLVESALLMALAAAAWSGARILRRTEGDLTYRADPCGTGPSARPPRRLRRDW